MLFASPVRGFNDVTQTLYIFNEHKQKKDPKGWKLLSKSLEKATGEFFYRATDVRLVWSFIQEMTCLTPFRRLSVKIDKDETLWRDYTFQHALEMFVDPSIRDCRKLKGESSS